MQEVPQIFQAFASPMLLMIKGVLIGIIASAPMGPVGILCIQRTMQKGREYGLVTGAGAALSDIIYALITGGALAFALDFVHDAANLFWMKLVGAAMLFIFGLYLFRSDPRKCLRPASANKGTLMRNFITAFFVTLSNPLIIFLFVALFNMFTFVVPDNIFGQSVGYLSIVGGAMLWWLGLTYVINRMKSGIGVRGIQRLNRTIGTVVLIVAVCYAIFTIFHWELPIFYSN